MTARTYNLIGPVVVMGCALMGVVEVSAAIYAVWRWL
jgi:hypothetical protein